MLPVRTKCSITKHVLINRAGQIQQVIYITQYFVALGLRATRTLIQWILGLTKVLPIKTKCSITKHVLN